MPQQDIDTELENLKTLARRLDALFRIPGTRLTIGIDNILGLLPVIGDIAAFAPALWLVWKGRKLGATPGAQIVMLGNLIIDFVVGSIPIVGDLFDIAYNANIRNISVLEGNLASRATRAKPARGAEYSL